MSQFIPGDPKKLKPNEIVKGFVERFTTTGKTSKRRQAALDDMGWPSKEAQTKSYIAMAEKDLLELDVNTELSSQDKRKEATEILKRAYQRFEEMVLRTASGDGSRAEMTDGMRLDLQEFWLNKAFISDKTLAVVQNIFNTGDPLSPEIGMLLGRNMISLVKEKVQQAKSAGEMIWELNNIFEKMDPKLTQSVLGAVPDAAAIDFVRAYESAVVSNRGSVDGVKLEPATEKLLERGRKLWDPDNLKATIRTALNASNVADTIRTLNTVCSYEEGQTALLEVSDDNARTFAKNYASASLNGGLKEGVDPLEPAVQKLLARGQFLETHASLRDLREVLKKQGDTQRIEIIDAVLLRASAKIQRIMETDPDPDQQHEKKWDALKKELTHKSKGSSKSALEQLTSLSVGAIIHKIVMHIGAGLGNKQMKEALAVQQRIDAAQANTKNQVKAKHNNPQ